MDLEQNNDLIMEENINSILNHDTLIQIFSFLHILDLISVSKTCTNFLAMAKAAFPSKFARAIMISNKPNHEINRKEIDSLFETFGDMIRQLKLCSSIFLWDHHDIEKYTLTKVLRHCSMENLKEISLRGFKQSSYDIVEALFDIYKNLTKLQLVNCSFNSDIAGILNKLKNLEELVICGCERSLNYQPENYFETIHLNMKKLIIRNIIDLNAFRVLNSIDFVMPNLRILEINRFNHDLSTQEMTNALTRIGSLLHLTKLKLNFQDSCPLPLMELLVTNKIKLEKLTLIDTKITTSLTHLIIKMGTLRKIKMSEVTELKVENILRLIWKLPLLSKMSIHRSTVKFNQYHVNILGEYLHTDFTLKLQNTGGSLFEQNRTRLMEKLISKKIKLTLLDLDNSEYRDEMEYDECPEDDYVTIIDNQNLKITHSCGPFSNPLKYATYDIRK